MAFIRRHKWLRYALSAAVLSLLFTVYHIITVEGEGRAPKFVLMRLEDIGPGGQYASLDQLGKLRAVLEYLRDEHAAYHLAVVPRWINLPPDGSRYDVSLDETGPYTEAYRTVLHQAVAAGATLGMHGYTHQVGSVRRDDGHHESGIGNEFNVPGKEETLTVAFAEQRLKEGLAILSKSGLKPQFWEAPHYRSTPEQDNMFRSFFGLNYQADVQTNRSAPTAQYSNARNNGYGASTLGAAYVPTPFDYIPYNKDEKLIIDRVGKSNHVPSFYFHPFLEFKHLERVTDENGDPAQRDGIPEYRYAAQGKSLLHKLVAGLKQKGYAFYSIQDYVPFTPAQSIQLTTASSGPRDKVNEMVADADGDGQADLITWDARSGSVFVNEGRFRGLRNEAPAAPALWAHANYAKGSAAVVTGKDADGLCSLWTANAAGKLDRYVSDGRRFVQAGSWKIEERGWSGLYALREPNGDTVIAGLTQDRMYLYGWLIRQGELKPLKPYKFRGEIRTELQPRKSGALFAAKSGASAGLQLQPDLDALQWNSSKTELGLPIENGIIKFGDYNGDGLEDAVRFDPGTMRYTVYQRSDNGEWKLLSTFGPWGKPGSVLTIADFDGNGKSDLGLINRTDGYLDTALSFERKY